MKNLRFEIFIVMDARFSPFETFKAVVFYKESVKNFICVLSGCELIGDKPEVLATILYQPRPFVINENRTPRAVMRWFVNEFLAKDMIAIKEFKSNLKDGER